MIVYNTQLLDHIAIIKKAKQWYANKLISTEQMASIQKKYPVDYFKPNFFIKIGLFLFTLFLIGAALGFFTLFTLSIFSQLNSMDGYGIVTSLIFACASFFALEKLIKWRNWFSNGIDDALLYSGLSFMVSVIAFSISHNLNDFDVFLILCLIMLPILFFCIRRYLDRIVSIVFICCLYTVFFLLIMKTGELAKMIMPFAFMLLSGLIYFYVDKQSLRDSNRHLVKCFKVINTMALIIFYLSGNYFVIRESSIAFFGLSLNEGEDIPLAFIFYAFTAIVPLVYLYLGLKNKDKLRLWVALLLIAIAVLTFKYYFSLGHPEITLTIAGIIMIAVAYLSIRYLKEDRKGITFKLDPDEETFLKSNAEALIIAQSFSGPVQSTDQGVDMGGGKFGGAGSGGNY